MASVGVAPASGLRESQMVGVDRLPEEMNDMKIRDDKVQSFCSVLFFFSLSLSLSSTGLFYLLFDHSAPFNIGYFDL